MEPDKNISYLILVVVYNIDAIESETINSLVNSSQYINNSSVIVWDNSTNAQKAGSIKWIFERIKHVEYIHKPENIPLSKVYNEVINKHSNVDYDYLILFDQDSTFTSDFFYQLNKSIDEFLNVSLFLPIVISDNNIVSPANLFLFKGNYWKSKKLGLVEAKNKAAINSGMVISFEYLKNRFVGYDERFLFYGTDTYFMKTYAKDNDCFCVFDGEILHHLAYCDNSNVDEIIKRHPENMKAVLLLNSDNFAMKVLTKFYLFLFSIKQSFKFRDIRFFKW